MPSFTTFTTFLIATLSLLSLAQCATLAPREITSSSKAGLAWPNGNYVDMGQFRTTKKVSWYYTWSPWPTNNTGIEFVPMLWGKNQINDFTSTLGNTLASNQVSAALAFNEPQQSGQSNLSPEDGASMWKEYVEPLKAKGLRLGSPAPSSAPNGKTWLQNFLTACDGGCTVDFIALHWYATNVTEFKRYLTDFHDTFQRPLWITEWACQNFAGGAQCKDDEVPVFLKETQDFMDATDWVERYSYFGAMKEMQGVNEANRLMNKNGKITNLGKQYIGEKSGGGDGDGSNDDDDGDGVTVNNAALSPRDGVRQFAKLCAVVAASISALMM